MSLTTDWLSGSSWVIQILFHKSVKTFFYHSKGSKRVGWNEECNQAFTAIKQYLTESPIRASSKASDTLYLYLEVSEVSVIAALFKEDENQKKRPIFFISKYLSEVETRYTRLEQAVLALCLAVKKLHPYFQAHPDIMLTNLSLQGTIQKPDLSRRMVR